MSTPGLKNVMTIFAGGKGTSCVVIKRNEEGREQAREQETRSFPAQGTGSVKEMLCAQKHIPGQGRPACSVSARAAMDVPWAGAGASSAERSLWTWLLMTGTGLQPAAGKTHSLANFP